MASRAITVQPGLFGSHPQGLRALTAARTHPTYGGGVLGRTSPLEETLLTGVVESQAFKGHGRHRGITYA